ncbi:MAG: hypothetical protein NTW21_00055, partial [Verrucomicrobia bacterium]|nr:hypothetical protein [Verrucomicrobiota bacterium]
SDMVINANWTFTRISARKSGSPYPAGQGTDYRVTHRSGAVDTTVVGFAGGARPGGTLYDSHGSSFAGLSVKAGDRVFWEIAGVGGTVDVDATGADITITSASPYASWAGGNGFDSLNSEGVAYGMAWVLGASTNASSSIGLLPESSNDSGKLVLTFDCLSAAGRGTAALTVQYSKDLGQADLWTNHEAAVPGAAGSSDVGSVHFEAAMIGDLIHVVATIPASEASTDGKLFARLMATE